MSRFDKQRANLQLLAQLNPGVRTVHADLAEPGNWQEEFADCHVVVVFTHRSPYGSAKAALSNFASGLRHRLFSKGVRVITIEPGFVDTLMTTDFKKGPLWVSAERVAAGIERALTRGFGVVYTPWFWR